MTVEEEQILLDFLEWLSKEGILKMDPIDAEDLIGEFKQERE